MTTPQVFRKINKNLPTLTLLELQYVSPKLLNAKDLDLAVPGEYLHYLKPRTYLITHTTLQVPTKPASAAFGLPASAQTSKSSPRNNARESSAFTAAMASSTTSCSRVGCVLLRGPWILR